MDVLSPLERLDPIWLKLEAHFRERRDKWIRSLIAKKEVDADEFRGRIKELEYLITPPDEGPTAHVHHPRASADEEGVHG